MLRSLSIIALVTSATLHVAHAAPSEKSASIVLVHGAFVDGSGWKATYDILSKDGYEVLVVQNSTDSLEGDVAATDRVIAQALHPVTLVGHSYGGMVITQAGANPKVQSLVYLAAFAPTVGESVASLNEAPAPQGETKAPLLPPRDGYLLVDPVKFPTAFAADIDPKVAQFMAAAQVPWGLGAVQARITAVPPKDRPIFFMVTGADRMIPPTAQRMMAKRAGATVKEIASSHAVMLSHPQAVAEFIKSAVPSP